MTPSKCLHLNSVTRFVLITILVSIFSQSFDCKPTSLVVETVERGNISNSTGSGNNDFIENNLINSPRCTSTICYEIPKKPVDQIDTDKRSIYRRRTGNPLDNGVGAKDEHHGKGRSVHEDVLYALQGYKITMDPSVEKLSEDDYRVILRVMVLRKADNRKEMELPSIAVPFEVLMGTNSSIEKVKEEMKSSVSSSTITNNLKNNNRNISANPARSFETVVTTPTDIGLKTVEDPTQPSNIDLSNQPDAGNQPSNAVSSSSLSTSRDYEGRNNLLNNENNDLLITNPTSTTLKPLVYYENNPSLTPLPANEVEMRQEKPSTSTKPEIITTPMFRIATPNPLDTMSASTLADLVTQRQALHVTANVSNLSTEVSKAVESRVISSTSSSLNSDSSSTKPEMSEIELSRSKNIYDKKNYKSIKPIPETPWVPAYEVKPIGSNKQDSNNHIEYRFSQHDNEVDVRRNIPSNQPKSRPQPQPKRQRQPQPQAQAQAQAQPRFPSQSRYGTGIEVNANNDRSQNMVKSDHPNPYVPRNSRVSFKERHANVPNNRLEPYAVEEIVHFERPIQRLNTRQYKPTPELFVRIIRHYFDNALSPAETIYTAKHKSPMIAPGQPLYQRTPSSLSYRNSKS